MSSCLPALAQLWMDGRKEDMKNYSLSYSFRPRLHQLLVNIVMLAMMTIIITSPSEPASLHFCVMLPYYHYSPTKANNNNGGSVCSSNVSAKKMTYAAAVLC